MLIEDNDENARIYMAEACCPLYTDASVKIEGGSYAYKMGRVPDWR